MNGHWLLLGILLDHLKTVDVFLHSLIVTDEIIFSFILSRITLFSILVLDGFVK